MRIILGAIFANHGYGKLFSQGPDGVTSFFTNVGIPAASLFAWVVSLLEFGGGIAVILGLLPRYIALGFVIDMTVAIAATKNQFGFPGLIAHSELELSLLAMAFVVLMAGPGKFSLDKLLLKREL
jgi:putative oxidoreductase